VYEKKYFEKLLDFCKASQKKKMKKKKLNFFLIYSHHSPIPPVRSGRRIKINLVQLLSKIEQESTKVTPNSRR
jgi:hypothetical protein